MVWSAVYFCRYQKNPYNDSTMIVGLENTNAVLPRSNLWVTVARVQNAEGPPGVRKSRYPTQTKMPNHKMNPCTTSAQITASNPPSRVKKIVTAPTPTTIASTYHPVTLE